MILKKIKIMNYRQLQSVELDMQESLTVLAGPNNSGKTTLISVLKGMFCDKKLGFSYSDIPISLSSMWLDKTVALAGCVACIENQIDIIGAIQKANAESDSKGFDGVNGTMPGIVSVFQNNIKFLQYAPLKQGGVIFANTNSYIISFDSTMEKYIHIVRPDNIKLIQKFKNKV